MIIYIAQIFAMARNRAIGLNNEIPWYIPDDFKRFKAITMGAPCIMGRKTFESIVTKLGKPLPGRTSIVVSKRGYQYADVPVFPNVDDAIAHAKGIAARTDKNEIFICGGAEIYASTLPLADRLYVTEVALDIPGDTFMPSWNGAEFQETMRDHHAASGETPAFTFINYERL